MSTTSRPFRLLADCPAVWQFMTEIYARDWSGGVAAPFFEYALSSAWMDKTPIHRSRLWYDGDTIVAFVFHENPVTDVYFSLRPGYEHLADEMISHALNGMPQKDGRNKLILFGGQTALMEAAARAGYRRTWSDWDMQYDFAQPLDYPLPEGYRFAAAPLDVAKCSECCWKGFGHEAEEGPWDGDTEYTGALLTAPHGTPHLDVAIENEAGEYVCYAGMWFVPENNLAYMEPLCTVPAHQHRGLAAAALSECYRRTKALGATHMTGGTNPFYAKIGYERAVEWTYWERGD